MNMEHQTAPAIGGDGIRTRVCKECGSEFSYTVGRGKDKKLCSKECRRESRKKLLETRPPCIVDDCENLGVYADGTCNSCYYRKRRTGSLERRHIAHRHIRPDGYVYAVAHGHPLATKYGEVYEHRKILYDAIGDGPHPCHWCGELLNWLVGKKGGPRGSIIIDHLDGNKANNHLDNLVPSCHRCNIIRGRLFVEISVQPDR